MNKMFSDRAFEDYIFWQANNKANVKKINSLLKSIERDGTMQGEGKTEKLTHRKNDYSRRIDKENRLVYEISNNTIVVKSCRGHYDN